MQRHRLHADLCRDAAVCFYVVPVIHQPFAYRTTHAPSYEQSLPRTLRPYGRARLQRRGRRLVMEHKTTAQASLSYSRRGAWDVLIDDDTEYDR
jgi:hypothetical protein